MLLLKVFKKFRDGNILFNPMMGNGHYSHPQTLILYLLQIELITSLPQWCQTIIKVTLTLKYLKKLFI